MRSVSQCAVLLLLDLTFAARPSVAEATACSALATALPSITSWLAWAMHTTWLGPGLILALILLLTLRPAPKTPETPVRHLFRRPRLERFRGLAPRTHRDLEI